MDKFTATAYLRGIIFERLPEGARRQRWLAWLLEASRAEESLQTLSELQIHLDDDEP
jgi:hypothetical protein